MVVVVDTGDPSGAEAGPDPDPGETIDAVSWSVAWDETGLSRLDGGGFALERDDGVALELIEGWLVVYSMVLEPCDELASRTPPPHGYAEHPSRIPEPVALALHDLAPVELGSAVFGAAAFCEAGVTIFQGAEGNPGMPTDGALDGLSFSMMGRLRPGPDAAWESFAMSSHLSAEHDLPLDGTATGAVAVEVVLSPAHLLDDLSLDQDPERIALGAIANLTETATATLSPGAQP